MPERCPLDTEKADENGVVWEPWIPDMCRRCILRTLSDKKVSKTEIDTSEETCAELGINPEDDFVDREHEFGIRKVGNGTSRVALEEAGIDIGGVRGAHPTLRTEAEFDCPIEAYELTGHERAMLSEVLVPDYEYRPNGKEDELTGFFYKKLIADQPEIFITAITTTKEFLNDDSRDPVGDEFNELKIDRLLAMVADMPVEVPTELRLGAWEAVLQAEWLHRSESPFATEKAIFRSDKNDPSLTVLINELLLQIIRKKKQTVRSAINFDETLLLDAENMGSDGMVRVFSQYPEAVDAYHSLFVLHGVQRQATQLITHSQTQQG